MSQKDGHGVKLYALTLCGRGIKIDKQGNFKISSNLWQFKICDFGKLEFILNWRQTSSGVLNYEFSWTIWYCNLKLCTKEGYIYLNLPWFCHDCEVFGKPWTWLGCVVITLADFKSFPTNIFGDLHWNNMKQSDFFGTCKTQNFLPF